MFGKVIVTSLISAVVLFVWGFLFWGILGGLGSLQGVPQEETVTSAIKQSITESGSYYYPAMPENSDDEAAMSAWEAKHMEGPLYTVIYHAEGADVMNGSMFIMGYLHEFIASIFMCFLLVMALPQLQSFGKRLGFVILATLTFSFFIDFTGAIWMYYPWNGAFVNFFYHIIGWFLAGLVIAGMIKPKTAAI